MRTEYTVTTARPAMGDTHPVRPLGLACAVSGAAGIAIGLVTLLYPAAVANDRWSYPFGATAQWIVSLLLAVTHLLTLAGFCGVLAVRPHGRSRVAVVGLWAAVIGCAGLAVCEVLSGAVGTRSSDSSMANAVGSAFGAASLLIAVGSIVAGVVIVRRLGLHSVEWSMVLWSGVALVVLVIPANISGKLGFEMAALMVWSLTFIPLGQALSHARNAKG